MRIISVELKKYCPRVSLLEMLFIVFMLWYYIIPSASTMVNFMYVLAIVFVYLFFVIQDIPLRMTKDILKVTLLALFIAACYWIFTNTSTIHTNVSNYQLKRFLSKFQQIAFGFFPILLFARLKLGGTIRQKSTILVIIFAMFAFVGVQTWSELRLNEDATRSWANFAEMSEANVGTYAFIYAVSALIPAILICIEYVQSLPLKLVLAAVIVVLFMFLLEAQYTLSLLLGAISIVVYIVICSRNTLLKILMVASIPFVFVVLPPILGSIASNVESQQVSSRLQEIANALAGNGLGYNLDGRLTLYKKTIGAFIRSPIWGNRSLGFDGHATLLTVWADVGILGGMPYFYLYFSSKERVSKLIGNQGYAKRFLPVFISFILLGFMNPIHSTMPLYIVVWLLTPLLVDVLGEQHNRHSVS